MIHVIRAEQATGYDENRIHTVVDSIGMVSIASSLRTVAMSFERHIVWRLFQFGL